MEVCTKDKLSDCPKGFSKLNSYELCKIPDDINLHAIEGDKITKFERDCYDSQCNPQEDCSWYRW